MTLQLDALGRVVTQLGGTKVTFDGTPLTIDLRQPSQINAVVPYEVAGQTSTQLQVTFQGKGHQHAHLACRGILPWIVCHHESGQYDQHAIQSGLIDWLPDAVGHPVRGKRFRPASPVR